MLLDPAVAGKPRLHGGGNVGMLAGPDGLEAALLQLAGEAGRGHRVLGEEQRNTEFQHEGLVGQAG
jgi:hypothetical protein